MSIIGKMLIGWAILAVLALVFNWAFWARQKRLERLAMQQRDLAEEQLKRLEVKYHDK